MLKPEPDVSFPTVLAGEGYARMAGFNVNNGVASRPDMKDSTFTLKPGKKNGTFEWKRD